MPRTPSITNEQILQAARKIFSRKGINASTVDIARKAGVSEGTLFKRFGTKEKLFLASMGFPKKPEWIDDLKHRVGRGEVRATLIGLSLEILLTLQEAVPRMMMLRSQGFSPLKIASALAEPPPISGIKAITEFLDQEQQLGRIRDCNPQIAARCLLGALMNYVFLEQIGVPSHMQIDPSEYVEEVISFLWQSLEPL